MPESFTSQITVDKKIVSLLSKFIYERSLPYALREVISNSYDADATVANVTIDFKKDKIVIHDNGNGMTKAEFEFYLRIAGQRRGKLETPKFGRKRIGQFGVGFLAILPFCEKLQIRSTSENSEEIFTAEIPSAKFFREEGKPVDVGEVDVPGEIERNSRFKDEHFTEISLLKLSPLADRYLHSKPQDVNWVANWPSALDRLKWELQEDLPLTFPDGSELNEILAYPEPIGMEVHLQGERLYRNSASGDVIESGQQTVDGISFKYAIVSPWKSIKPFDLRGVKMRLNNVGIGKREQFGIDITRQYSRLHWLTGELTIVRGLDGAVTLSRDSFLGVPEYEALREKAAAILRKSALYIEKVDEAARDVGKHLRGGKQVSVASKRAVVDKNVKSLSDRGFTVTRVATRSSGRDTPIQIDRTRKEVVVYDQHPAFEDLIEMAGKKRRVIYIQAGDTPFEGACRINSQGDVEINTDYHLFRSKRYGDIFKKLYVIAAIAKKECTSPERMYKFILSQVEKEFEEF